MKDLNLLITISRRSDEKEFEDFFADHGLSVILSAPCEGTTNSQTLSLLGIERTDKTVYFSVATGDEVRRVIKKLKKQMYIDLPDRGISIALPLCSVGGAAALGYLTHGKINERQDNPMKSEFELIVAIANNDSTDIVMNAARQAGARGGTVLHTKGTASAEDKKFFGISIAEAREMIFIVAASENKADIMKAIMHGAGPDTPANAYVFSLPITACAGFSVSGGAESEDEENDK